MQKQNGTIILRLPAPYKRILQENAEKKLVSMSALVRELIIKWADENRDKSE